MKNSLFLSLALGTGWLLSPESLVITGNAAGQMGWMTLPLLASVALLFTICGRLLSSPRLPTTANKEQQILTNMAGNIPATSLSIAASIPLLVLAATALLVTSGYTFNEVFLYWFPNFGFSFLILAFLTLLQFFSKNIIFKAQILFVSLAAGGLLFLALYGITTAKVPVTNIFLQPGSFLPGSSAVLLLLFAGSNLTNEKTSPRLLIPIVAFVLFFCWILASLAFVAPERLASSTIPYMTAARKIMGDPGRQIMGMVIISGTCAAITTLLLLSRQMLSALTNGTQDKQKPSNKVRWIFPPLFAILTGALMATGLAGDELLEVLLRGALILWLLHYTLLCLSALVMIRQKTDKIPPAEAICTLILIGALITLITGNPHRSEIIIFILSMLGISGLLGTIWFFINKNVHTDKTTQS